MKELCAVLALVCVLSLVDKSQGLGVGLGDLRQAGGAMVASSMLLGFSPQTQLPSAMPGLAVLQAVVMTAPTSTAPVPAPAAFEQSERWEQSRAKRTAAIKAMEQKGMLKVNTDDSGNQFLSLPWIPNRKVPYKSLSLQQQLVNEVCAGAFGEISKDVLLHSVDTAKTRRQAQKKAAAAAGAGPGAGPGAGAGEGAVALTPPTATASATATATAPASPLAQLRDLYAGFPAVLFTSIPQGGAFFLTKKTLIAGLGLLAGPEAVANPALGQALPIGVAVCAYWLFRTPAEVLKTQVQTGQLPSVAAALQQAKEKDADGLRGLWRYYPVMLSLDIPFQVVNFILFGALSEAVAGAGVESSVWTRLLCGTTCGMISAGLTCPLDVCKTRIISRDRAQQEAAFAERERAKALGAGAGAGAEASFAAAAGAGAGAGPGDGQGQPTPPAAGAGAGAGAGGATAAAGNNKNMLTELVTIYGEEGAGALFLGIRQRLAYTGLANGIRLAAYGTSRMDLMMRSLESQ